MGRRIVWSGAVLLVLLGLAVSGATASFAGRGAALPPPDTCIAPLLPCYIALSIYSGSHGNHETVSGYRFWPGEPFSVYFWNGTAGATAPLVATGSTGIGGFSVSFSIPKAPVGSYTIFVTDLAGDNQSAPFRLTHLVASPSSGAVGNSTTLKGQGFLPDHVVKFHLDGVRAPTAATCTTNAYGNFSGCRVTIPNVPTGSHRLTVTDGTYVARIDFDVS